MRYNKQAFTLIEIIIVIGLFGLIVMLGMKQFSFLDDIIVHTQVDNLAVVCLYLQQKAIVTHADQSLVCDTQKNQYRFDNVFESLSKRVSFGYIPYATGSPGSPSRSIKKAITFADSTIRFYPTGIISSGAVYLTDMHKKVMYALTNGVSQVSYLRFYRYDGTWKLL